MQNYLKYHDNACYDVTNVFMFECRVSFKEEFYRDKFSKENIFNVHNLSKLSGIKTMRVISHLNKLKYDAFIII